MNFYIPNTNPNLTVVRRASDGTISLVPIICWGEFRLARVPVDLTHMGTDWAQVMYSDFAIHDAVTGRVYLRNGDVFDTLVAFAEASR
ncbi:MAG: hypothetical protein RSE14_00605 [Erythrobacter sp.]|jgi:hypothetical protein|uniref:hypothetical protein n=1 Tax=Erythrobacter sp. TaxID=1042 RepID=UPI002B483894|nr:hypothetical protein [Erythrobacter sp.]WRH70624.1 MAG: hypothetical protein RSE14_00605 [Erythrobacter sp.]